MHSIVTHSESNCTALHSCSGGWTKPFWSVKMLKLSSVDRARAIGHLEAGWKQQDVAVLFGASQSTISKLQLRYRDAHDVKDRPRGGRPRITTDKSGSFNSPGDFGESSHHCTQPTDALSRTSWQAGVYTDHQKPTTCFPVEIPESCPEASPNSWSLLITSLACELCLTISVTFGVYIQLPPYIVVSAAFWATLKGGTAHVVMTVLWIFSGRRSERPLGHASSWGAVGGRFLTCTELEI